MQWTQRLPGFTAITLFAIALFATHCAPYKPGYKPPTVAEMDTSDHDLVKSDGQPVPEASPLSEDNQTQNMDPQGTTPLVDAPCKTKYPILLVHGVALRDTVAGMNYFGRIPAYLKDKCKVDVYQGGQDAFSIMSVNADQLKDRLLYLTDKLGYKKVNVIAHSKGGLDMRMMFFKTKDQMFSGRTMLDRVASFTTLSTPHRGAVLADYLLSKFSSTTEKVVFMALNIFGFAQKDSKEINAEDALVSLSPEKMVTMNQLMGDLDSAIPSIYCQSWGANISGYIADPALWTSSKMIASTGSKVNDGAVEEASAKYGNYRGTVGQGLFGGVSHFAIVDRALGVAPGNIPGFKVLDFYTDMLAELKGKGF